MAGIIKTIRRFIREEDGPTAVEYATLLGIIAAGALTALSNFGDKVHNLYQQLKAALDTA